MTQSVSPQVLKSRVDQARLLGARLRGAREADQRQLAEWTERVGTAKARLALSDEVSRIFEAMQTRAHSRSVGTFETLLSAILQDVLPDKGNIRFELSNSNNSPNLDIFVDNGGALEDVLEGSGGAVTNVISAGLRFAALTRTKNRRIMVLDEPDCWIKPSRVPNFIRVVADVARTTKTQTLLISHHDPAYFRGRVNLIELTRDASGEVQAEPCEPVVSAWESPSQPGIRSIQLINFRAHKNTTLKLFPGVTALIGDNDLGKSTALVSSLKAVGYNESDDTVIHHGAKEAQIVIELENERRIIWTRKAKGSPKVVYALYHGTELVAEGKAPGRGSVPDWVKAELGISEVDDLDIQVGSQKNPVFLLDQPASRRAQLLSVGRESGHLVGVMDAWGDIKRTDRETVREGEARVSRLTYRLERLAALDAALPQAEQLAVKFAEVEAFSTKFQALERVLRVMADCDASAQRLAREVDALNALPAEAPQLQDVQKLQDLMARIQRGQPVRDLALPELQARAPELADTVVLSRVLARIAQLQKYRPLFAVELPDLQVAVPELQDTTPLKRVGVRISQLQKYRPLFNLDLPTLPELPALTDERMLAAVATRMNGLRATVAQAERDQLAADAEHAKAQAELKATQAKLGVCPLCDHRFDEEHTHAHVE